MATEIEKTTKSGRRYKPWVNTRSRKEAMAYGREVAHIIFNIGKKYRNKEAHLFKVVPKSIRARKRK